MKWALGWALLALLVLGLKAEEVAKEPLRHGKSKFLKANLPSLSQVI